MYAARHGLNDAHLRLLWTNLGHFVSSTLSARKVRSLHVLRVSACARAVKRALSVRNARACSVRSPEPFAAHNAHISLQC